MKHSCSLFCGDPADEEIVAAAAKQFAESNRRKPRATPLPHRFRPPRVRLRTKTSPAGAVAPARGAGKAALGANFAGGKARRRFLQQRKIGKKAVPPEALEGARKGRDLAGVVKAYPLDAANLHAVQKGAAVSVQRKRIRAWLESERGREWKRERAQLHRADDPGDYHSGEE